MNFINDISHYFFIINLYLSFIFIRFPDIFSASIFRFFIYFIFIIGFIVGLISCFIRNKKITISLFLFICAIIIHAFSIYYQPSLRPNISIQNYVLQNNITSDFLMTQARLYMIFIVCFIFPAISFFSDFFEKKKFNKYIKILFISYLICFILNSFVSMYQSLVDIQFFAKGNGTSVNSSRSSGLLDDSGVASCFFAITISVMIPTFFRKEIILKYKILTFILIIFCLLSGLLNNSRSFIVGIVGTFIIFSIYEIIVNIKNKEFKLLFKFFIFLTVNVSIIFVLLNYKLNTAITRLNSFFNAILINRSFIGKYSLIDEQRSAHLQIMLESIKEKFFIGTGFGSFSYNFYYQINKDLSLKNTIYDMPTNTFFSIISDLGIVGLLLILFFVFIYFNYIFKFSYSNLIENNIFNLIVVRLFPIWAGVIFFILALIGYMFYIPSMAYISCLIVAPCIIVFIKKGKYYERFFYVFFLGLSSYLMIVVIYLAILAPKVPAFQWESRGVPQVPMPLGSLPQPQGQTEKNKIYFSNLIYKFLGDNLLFKPDGAFDGQWFKSETEFLLNHANYRIYIGPETRNFPIEVSIVFHSKNGDIKQDKYIVTKASWLYYSTPRQIEFENCFNNITSGLFCYYYVSVKPAWKPSIFKSIGFYIENEYISYRNIWR